MCDNGGGNFRSWSHCFSFNFLNQTASTLHGEKADIPFIVPSLKYKSDYYLILITNGNSLSRCFLIYWISVCMWVCGGACVCATLFSELFMPFGTFRRISRWYFFEDRVLKATHFLLWALVYVWEADAYVTRGYLKSHGWLSLSFVLCTLGAN